MSRYERAYGTDWDSLDKDEAIDRAYALGVAAAMEEYHPEELEAIRAEVDTSYNKSVVELAFDEGRTEARELDAGAAGTEQRAVWSELVEGETVTVDEDAVPTGGRDGLPEAIEMMEALERPDPNENEAIDRPDFLERD
jgi:hypothetical protein